MDIGPAEIVPIYQNSFAEIRALYDATAGMIMSNKSFSYTDATEVSLEAEGVTLYELFPYDAKENYTFEIVKNLEKHYHKVPTQLMLLLDGAVEIALGGKFFNLGVGDFIVIPPNTMHSIKPKGAKSYFLIVDFPGFNYPEEGYEWAPIESIDRAPYVFRHGNRNVVDTNTTLTLEIAPMMQILTDIIPKYYLQKKEFSGYVVYDIAADRRNKWVIALLNIMTAKKHFHNTGYEHFIVLTGALDITLEEKAYRLLPGQSVNIRPNTTYHLKSAKKDHIRVLRTHFPAFSTRA